MWISLCERVSNKRKVGTFHRDNTTTCTTHHCTAARKHELALRSGLTLETGSPTGPGRTPTVHWGRYDGWPWVAQPHEHAHARQVTDTQVVNTCGAFQAWWRSKGARHRSTLPSKHWSCLKTRERTRILLWFSEDFPTPPRLAGFWCGQCK